MSQDRPPGGKPNVHADVPEDMKDVLAGWLKQPPKNDVLTNALEGAQEDGIRLPSGIGGDWAPVETPAAPSRSQRPAPVTPPDKVVPDAGTPEPPPPNFRPQPQVAPLRLQIVSGGHVVEQVIREQALIGRPDPNKGIQPDIALARDTLVSRRHAMIYRRDGIYTLADLNSRNGTKYNRQPLVPDHEVTLKAGDEIELSEHTRIRVLDAPKPNA